MSTYGARLRARLDPKHPCNQSFNQPAFRMSEEAEEEIFQEKLTGGYNTKRSNRCERCFTAKSANGSCNCT